MKKVESTGKTVIITDNGRPSLKFKKVAEDQRDPFEILKGSVPFYDRPFEPVDEDEWEALG